jgi:hypothetical protein
MVRNRPPLLIASLMCLLFAGSLFASGQVWDFLGYAQVDGNRDHSNIPITRRDHLFRTIQVRLTGDAIFFDHLVVHFADGSNQNVVIGGRISPEEKEYVVDLPAEGRALERVELFYFKEPWQHTPKVTLYGLRLPAPDGESQTAIDASRVKPSEQPRQTHNREPN